MIVITTISRGQWHLSAGDTFSLIIGTDSFPCTADKVTTREAIIKEEITETGEVDFCASFRFTQEDGTCIGNHFCGIFAKESELPEEIKNARFVDNLSQEQLTNFTNSVNVKI